MYSRYFHLSRRKLFNHTFNNIKTNAIERIQLTERGARLFPRKEIYDQSKQFRKKVSFWAEHGSSYSSREHQNVTQGEIIDKDKRWTTEEELDKNLKEAKKNWQPGKYFNLIMEQEREERIKSIERMERGWVRSDFMRALHCIGYGHVKDLYGAQANFNPFRHLKNEVIEVNCGQGYKQRRIAGVRRNVDDSFLNANVAFCSVSAAGLNKVDYWISQGAAHKLLEARRNGLWTYVSTTYFSWRMLKPNFADRVDRTEQLNLRLRRGKAHRIMHIKNDRKSEDPSVSIWEGKRFPLPLGREFCGILEDCGGNVAQAELNKRVWGVKNVHEYGTCSDYNVCKGYQISEAPSNLSDTEVASLPYAGLTCFAAFQNVIQEDTAKGKKVLVIGGAGNMGYIAIQILKAWGAQVWTICSKKDGKYLVNTTSVDMVVNYDDEKVSKVLDKIDGKFDFVLNCSSTENEDYKYSDILNILIDNGWYVTLNTTFFQRADQYGSIRAPFAFGSDHTKFRKYFNKNNKKLNMLFLMINSPLLSLIA